MVRLSGEVKVRFLPYLRCTTEAPSTKESTMMKKFTYVFKSAAPGFEGWTWELSSVMPDWMNPHLFGRKEHENREVVGPVSSVLHVKPAGWPDGVEWICPPRSIDDAYRTLSKLLEYELHGECPRDVVVAALEKISDIRTELDQANAALRAVISRMKEQLRGLDAPVQRCIPALSPFPSEALPQAFEAARLLALEASRIQRELDRLASAPVLRSAVADALSALPGFYLDEPAHKARSAAMQAAAECGAFGPDPGSAAAIAEFLASQKIEKPVIPDELFRSRCSKCGHRE